jgi:uncharacterized membrane protein YfcA
MAEWLLQTLGTGGLLKITLAVGLGAALQGSVGYGMALLASPFLIMIEPRLIPGPYLLASQMLSLLMVLRESHAIDFNGVKWALIGRLPGTVLAGYLLATISQKAMVLTFGFLVLLGVVISVAGVRFPPRPKNLFFAGMLSAVMGTIATIGGPPMALVYQDASSDSLRSTLSGYFIVGGLISLATLVVIGRFGQDELRLSVTLLPGILFGYLVSSRLLPLLKSRNTRAAVLVVAAASGAMVIVRQIFHI